jgi:anti-sigma B factor antagonist
MAKAAKGSTALTVDLTDVTYCDSAAVRALFAVAATTRLTMMVASTGPIKTLFGRSGLDRVAAVVTME